MAAADITVNSPAQSAKTARTPRKSRRAAKVTVVILAILIAFCWYIGVFGGNVRAIQPGRAYRSAQLTGFNYTALTARWLGNDLNSVLERDHIRTVICLRGGSTADAWYREELADCSRHQAAHQDVPFSARSLPTPATLKALLDVFDHAQYPIPGGRRSNRTGKYDLRQSLREHPAGSGGAGRTDLAVRAYSGGYDPKDGRILYSLSQEQRWYGSPKLDSAPISPTVRRIAKQKIGPVNP